MDDLAAPEGDPKVYAASTKVGVVAVDAATGNPVWTAQLPGANHVTTDGPRVFASGRGALVALSRADGKVLWTLPLKDRYFTAPSVTSGLVLVALDRGPLMAVDAVTGRTRGAFDPGSGFSGAALVIPGAAFVISNAGVLFSLGLVP